MFPKHWLHQLSQRWFLRGTERSHRALRVPARTRPAAKPMLEVLEDRLVLSATVTELATPPGDSITDVYGINSSGQVVGEMISSSSNSVVAFVYSNGQITNLGTLPGVQGGDAFGINSSGQVVGEGATSSSSAAVAFLYSDGKTTDLNTLIPADSRFHLFFAKAINDSGQIVGQGQDLNSNNSGDSAFLYSNGQITDLGTLPGDNASGATAINSSGQVVGFSRAVAESGDLEDAHAFLYSNGKMTDLGTLPGYTYSDAIGINASGQVAGDSFNRSSSGDTTYQATLYSNGKLTDLGALPGDTESVANAINASGQVVGGSYSSSSVHDHAFLYSNGQMIDLNSLLPTNSGWVLEDAKAINDSGEIVGDGLFKGQGAAFLLNLNVSLSPASLPTGAVNSSYTQAITASGGIGVTTLSYKVTSGTIPNGLTFTPKPNELDISGTPAATGTVTFTVTATDSATPPHSITQTYTLTINTAAAPVITGNPSSQTVLAGSNVSFTASASGSPTPTVQWQVSRDKGATWTDVSGATSTTLTLNNASFSLNGDQYRAAFTNSVGSGTSTPATLTVQTMPTITSGNNAAFPVGQGGSFIVTATGSPRPTLTESGALPSGVTFTNNGNGTATLHGIPAPGTSGTYHFTISAHSSAGSVTQNFTLKVNSPSTPVFIVPPLLAFFDSLLGGTETVNADGTATVTDSFFGFPLLVSTFDSHGDLESVYLFGINVTALFELL